MKNDLRKKMFEKARLGVAEAFSKKDASLIQATRALDDLDNVKSLFSQRLAEWTGANYPEYSLKNDENTARVFSAFGAKEAFAANEAKLAEIVGAPKARELCEKAKTSYGVEFTKTERDAVRTLATLTAAVYAERTVLQEFVEAQARENAKNISTLIEPLLAARLISLAGGLEKLARMSASTIQVIGAEKALFKHLRTGSQPPKHGLIFQSPLINAAPLHQRGKISRALATKLSIAAKADWFTGRFIADKLKAKLDARLAQIRGGPEPSDERKRELRANEQRRQAERQRDWQNARSQRNPPRGGFSGSGASSGGDRREFRLARSSNSGSNSGSNNNRNNNENREYRKRDGERLDSASGGSRERREYGHGERNSGGERGASGERGGFEHEKRGGNFRKFRKFDKFRR
ncbi:MAG: C/D box methylation guide ribonucleoprotein complex aNOP56 subunit [Candidatus Micrarchaeota archaeon]